MFEVLWNVWNMYLMNITLLHFVQSNKKMRLRKSSRPFLCQNRLDIVREGLAESTSFLCVRSSADILPVSRCLSSLSQGAPRFHKKENSIAGAMHVVAANQDTANKSLARNFAFQYCTAAVVFIHHRLTELIWGEEQVILELRAQFVAISEKFQTHCTASTTG